MVELLRVCKALFFSFFLLMVLSISQAFAQENCVPTCNEMDGKFLALSPLAADLSTLSGEELRIEIITDSNQSQLELGIFDADHGETWDQNRGAVSDNVIRYTIFADPDRTGDSAGLTQVAEFLSNDLQSVDNDWRDITLDHHPDADNGQGNNNYLIEITFQPGATGNQVLSGFKVRVVEGEIVVLPNNIIGIAGKVLDENNAIMSLPIVFPDLVHCNPPIAIPGNGDFTSCVCNTMESCIDPTTYDGDFSFDVLLDAPLGYIVNELVLWDGDLDFGDGPTGTGPDDMDDPDTPNVIPDFSISDDTVAEGASATGVPPENNSTAIARRGRAVTYELISPDGTVYTNDNPSGTEEWERFTLRLNDHPDGCDDTGVFPNANADFCVGSILAGIWTVNVLGLDLENTIFFRTEFTTMRVEPVPALTRWGIMMMVVLFGMIILLNFRQSRGRWDFVRIFLLTGESVAVKMYALQRAHYKSRRRMRIAHQRLRTADVLKFLDFIVNLFFHILNPHKD